MVETWPEKRPAFPPIGWAVLAVGFLLLRAVVRDFSPRG